MARDNSGNYSVPTTLTAGTTARASDINTLVDDLGDEITDSLSRTGKGAMSAALKATAGTAGAPSLTFESDTDTGLYLKASNKLGISGGGSEVAYFASTSAVIAAAIVVLSAATQFSAPSASQVSFANATTVTFKSAAKIFAGTVQVPPTGSIMPYAGSSAPTGWLFCNGQALATTGTYAALYAVIGNTYDVMWGQSSPGAGNFRVPDLRGAGIFGWEGMGSVAGRITTAGSGIDGNTIASFGGAETHTLTTAQIPSHNHTYNNVSSSVVSVASPGSNITVISGIGSANTGNAGSGNPHNNMPPIAILPWIIKY